MLDEKYESAIRDGIALFKEVGLLDQKGELTNKEIAKIVTKKRLVEIHSRLSSLPLGSKTGEQVLQIIRRHVDNYRRTESLSRGIFP